jgi:hypothetical protein
LPLMQFNKSKWNKVNRIATKDMSQLQQTY